MRKTLASKLRSIGFGLMHNHLKLPLGDVCQRRECAADFPHKGTSFADAVIKGKGEMEEVFWIQCGQEELEEILKCFNCCLVGRWGDFAGSH